MLVWLEANFLTILVSLVVFGVLALIVGGMVREKKKGKSVTCGGCSGSSGCSGNCAHCKAVHAEKIAEVRRAKAAKG